MGKSCCEACFSNFHSSVCCRVLSVRKPWRARLTCSQATANSIMRRALCCPRYKGLRTPWDLLCAAGVTRITNAVLSAVALVVVWPVLVNLVPYAEAQGAALSQAQDAVTAALRCCALGVQGLCLALRATVAYITSYSLYATLRYGLSHAHAFGRPDSWQALRSW